MGLIVLATVAALVGGVAFYLRAEIVNTNSFADRSVDAIHKPAVQEVVSREITVQLLEPAVPDAIAGRPLVQSAVNVAIASPPFADLLRLAAVHGHRLLFQRGGGNAVFDIADAATVVTSALQKFAPKIAKEIPKRTDAVLLTLKKRSFAGTTLRVANAVRILGTVLPVVALALFVTAIAIAPDRRRALTRMGISIGIAGLALAILLGLVKRALASTLIPPPELTTAQTQAAFGALWDSYLADLTTATLVITASAWVLAAAAAPVLSPYSGTAGLQRARVRVFGPASTPVRGVRSAAAVGVGLLAILDPSAALRAFAIIGGALLIYVGAGEFLAVTAPKERRVKHPRHFERRFLITAGGFAAACVAVAAFLLAFTGATSSVAARSPRVQRIPAAVRPPARRGRVRRHAQLDVRRRLAGLADPQPGPGDRAQLQDGIRVFKISTHYGVGDRRRARVHRYCRRGTAAEPSRGQALPVRPRWRSSGSAVARGAPAGSGRSGCATRCASWCDTMVEYLGRDPPLPPAPTPIR